MTTPTTKCFKIKKEWIHRYQTLEASVATTKPSPKLITPTKKRSTKKRTLGIKKRPSGKGVKKLSPELQKRVDHRNACLQVHRACALSDIKTFGSYIPDNLPTDPSNKRTIIVTEPFLNHWLEKKYPHPI